MATGKEAVVTLKINGIEYALDTAEKTAEAIEKIKATAEKKFDVGYKKAFEDASQSVFGLEQQLEAVNKLGFNKAVAQGFIQTREEIENVSKALDNQLAETKAGTAEFEKNSKAAQDAQKAVAKFAAEDLKAQKEIEKAAAAAAKAEQNAIKETEKIRRDAIKSAVAEQGGFAKAVADGTIKTNNDIKTALAELEKIKPFDDKDLQDAQKFAKVYLKVYRDFGQDTEDIFKNVSSGLTVINQQTGDVTFNVEALDEAFAQLPPELQKIETAAKELDLQLDNLSVNELAQSISEVSTTQIQKELANLVNIRDKALIDGDLIVADEINEKIGIIQQELEDRLLPAFADLSYQEVTIEIKQSSLKRLKAQQEDLQVQLEKLKPSDEGYQDIIEKLKLVKNEIINVEEQFAGIKNLDVAQAFVDIGTKATEGLANASRAVGALGGNLAEAEELAAQFDKALQVISVAQSALDGAKAYAEAMKGVNGSLLTAANGAKVFKLALAATGIGAITLVIALLISQFGGLKKVLGVVTDALSSVGDVVNAFIDTAKNNLPQIGELFKNLGLAVVNFLTLPLQTVVRTVKSLYDVISGGKGIADAFKDNFAGLVDPIKDAFNGAVDLAGKAGENMADAFNKGFNTRQKLRANELEKALVETANAGRAARKTIIDAELNDATKGFEDRRKLAKAAAAEEQTAAAESLRVAREREALLRELGANASEEQKTELKELQMANAQASADLVALKKAQLQAERDAIIAEQDYRLGLLQLANEKELAALERKLAMQVELQTITAEDEQALIRQTQALRESTIDKEIENIKSRGKLSVDEQRRLIELENERAIVIQETNDRLKESTKRRLEEIAAIRAAELELKQTQLDGEIARNELAAKRGENEQAAADKRLELARRELDSTKDIAAARKVAEDNAMAAQERAIAAARKEADFQLKQLNLDKQRLQVELDRLKAKEAAVGLTKEETLQVENLTAQVENLDTAAQNVELGLSLDTDKIKAETKQGLEDIGKQAQADALANIADPVGSALRDALKKGLNIDDEAAQALIDNFSELATQVATLVTDIFAAQAEAIGEQIDAKVEEIDAAKEQADAVTQELQDNLNDIQSLRDQVAAAQGANQDAVIEQLNNEISKRGELQNKEKAALEQTKKLEKEKERLEAEKLEKEKAAARVQIAIDTAQAYVKLALAIANAATVPFPVSLAAIASVAAAGVAAIVSTIALAGSFRKGGQIPKAQRGGLLQGASHENGGIPIAVNGRQVVEAEGGEFILTKGVSQNPQLAKIASWVNVAGGGVPLAESGGLISDAGLASITSAANPQALTADVVAGFKAAVEGLPAPVVGVNEFESVRAKVTQQTNRLTV